MTAGARILALGACIGACVTLAVRTRRESRAAVAWERAWRSECDAHDATRARMQQRETQTAVSVPPALKFWLN